MKKFLHTIPKLHLDPQRGIPNLYSPKGLQVAWNDVQNDALSKLNRVIVDTDNEARVPFHIMQATKAKPEQAHIFNYASQVYNNHLFFANLHASGSTTPPPQLLQRINAMYGSMDGLKAAFHEHANEITSCGYVFLVETANKDLKIVKCHVTGSPSTFSRVQTEDLNYGIEEDAARDLGLLLKAVSNRKKNWNMEILALNLWPHAYLTDFGVDGKEKYIDAWWNAIDWEKVDARLFRGRI